MQVQFTCRRKTELEVFFWCFHSGWLLKHQTIFVMKLEQSKALPYLCSARGMYLLPIDATFISGALL